MAEVGNLSFINIDGKPVEKLIEVVSQAIGTIYRPISIRKEAKAKAFEIEVLEKAKSKALAESKFMEADTLRIIEQKFLYQQLKKQSNIDQIIDVAIDQVSQEEEVSQEPIDSDWSTRFFNIAEDISNDEMQKLWGRILSGEVKQPGSFSLRTLEILKNLSKEEAEIFTKFSQLKIVSTSNSLVLKLDNDVLDKMFNISYSDILLLIELGLISGDKNLGLTLQATGKKHKQGFDYGEKGILMETEAKANKISISMYMFTKTGAELSKLIPQKINLYYLNLILQSFSSPYRKITHGDIVIINGEKCLNNECEYKNLE